MKNVRDTQLQKCFVKSKDEFTDDVKRATSDEVIYYGSTDLYVRKHDGSNCHICEIEDKLSEFYDTCIMDIIYDDIDESVIVFYE